MARRCAHQFPLCPGAQPQLRGHTLRQGRPANGLDVPSLHSGGSITEAQRMDAEGQVTAPPPTPSGDVWGNGEIYEHGGLGVEMERKALSTEV